MSQRWEKAVHQVLSFADSYLKDLTLEEYAEAVGSLASNFDAMYEAAMDDLQRRSSED